MIMTVTDDPPYPNGFAICKLGEGEGEGNRIMEGLMESGNRAGGMGDWRGGGLTPAVVMR